MARRASSLVAALTPAKLASVFGAAPVAAALAWRAPPAAVRGLASSSAPRAADLSTEIEHATGLERDELVAKAGGRDMWREDWLDAPFGTATAPVAVTSVFSERVVGVADPADDSIIWWGTIKEGEPPKQLVEGGEYFVLKRIGDDGGHH